MTWECAECHATGDDRRLPNAVCHHCGKLLCRADQRVIADVAFDPAGGEADQTAIHCRACWRQHHLLIDIPLGHSDR